jgi:hypothetical protein
MKEFKDLEFKELPDGSGIYSRIMFENGYGVSVIRHKYSYGGKDGLYELAVLDTDGELHYDNPVAEGDVHGYLNEEGVTELLKGIQLL